MPEVQLELGKHRTPDVLHQRRCKQTHSSSSTRLALISILSDKQAHTLFLPGCK